MDELIQQLTAAGLTEEQSYKAIEIIKNFTKKKFPIFSGAIDRLFERYGTRQDEDYLD